MNPQDTLSGPPNTERLFVEIVEEICAAHDLSCARLSGDWILDIVEEATGRSTRTMGYRFEINTSAADRIADDKVAMSELMDNHHIPNITHRLVLRPDYFLFSPSGASAFSRLHEIYEALGPNVVAKPNEGTGGIGVRRCDSLASLEQAAMHVFADSHSLAVAKYVEIQEERRIVVVQGDVMLAYAKFPAPDDWRHNLGQGATAKSIPLDNLDGADIALDAAAAAGLQAGAVDLVLVDEDWYVLEVNPGLVFEGFGRLSPENRQVVTGIYQRVIMACLDRA